MSGNRKRKVVVEAARDLDARLRRCTVENMGWLSSTLPPEITASDIAKFQQVLAYFGVLSFVQSDGRVKLVSE